MKVSDSQSMILPTASRRDDRALYLPEEPKHEQALSVLRAVKVGTIATFVFSLVSMFVAALCTVALIILSRRATLRRYPPPCPIRQYGNQTYQM